MLQMGLALPHTILQKYVPTWEGIQIIKPLMTLAIIQVLPQANLLLAAAAQKFIGALKKKALAVRHAMIALAGSTLGESADM